MSRKITIVGAGGFGTEILAKFMQSELGQATAEHLIPMIIDTSDSNFDRFRTEPWFKDVKIHLTPGTDGGGKVRAANVGPLTDLVTNLVNNGTFEDEGAKIIIYSAVGSSGGIAGPELACQLTAKKKSVFNMVLEVDESIQDLENTIKVLRTLQFRASQTTRHNNVFWGTNRFNGVIRQSEADENFLFNLQDLVTLSHPDNDKIDSRDLNSFLNWAPDQSAPGVVRFVSNVAFNTIEKVDGVEPPAEDLSKHPIPTTAMSLLSGHDVDPTTIPGTGACFQGIVAKGLSLGEGLREVQFQLFSGRSAQKLTELTAKLGQYQQLAEKAAEQAAGDTFRAGKNDTLSESGQFL